MFGKIPARGDFVRLGPTSPILDVLDDLSQRALRSRSVDRVGPLYRTIVMPPRGPHAFVGALRMSRDTVGRAFPIIIGRTVPRRALDPDASPSWPLRWSSVLDGSARLVVHSERAPLPALEDGLTHLPGPPPAQGRDLDVDTHVRAIRALPAHALWTRTWGDPDAERIALVASRLAATTAGPVAYGLRVSLPAPAPGFQGRDAVAFWLAVFWHLLPKAPPPTLFWTGGPPAALYAFFGDVSPAAFRALLTGVPNTDRIATLDDGPASARVRALSGLRSGIRTLLLDPEASVADVLDRLPSLR